jgi:hypothetical protein
VGKLRIQLIEERMIEIVGGYKIRVSSKKLILTLHSLPGRAFVSHTVLLELASEMLTKLGRHFKCRLFIAKHSSAQTS